MNPERHQALQYLRAPADGLWRWTENGTVLVWHDGATIAFREEIIRVLEWLAPNGLPSFGSIVFLLAACRAKVPAVTDILTTPDAPLPKGMGKDAAVLLSARSQLRAQLTAALAELTKVAKLPAELNSGLKAKCVLAEVVFEPAKVERHVEAKSILQGLQEPMHDVELLDHEFAATAANNYIRQIHIVAEGLKLHTPETLSLRLRTGLDALPAEIDASLPAAERARRLIDELSRDHELGMVARAARKLMAAVRLPRRLGERDELALGGVADITNRGPLDRLLLSELAHDDLTLSARVALNEALYLRREPPMREPPGTLALLLDSGVRLWGVPRVLATALALAFVARDRQHSEVQAWRPQGKRVHAVDLLSRKGLTEHLGTLEPQAHAGDSIRAFAETLPADAQSQSILITHRDALHDADFRRTLTDHPTSLGFIATIDREGRFELHALPLAHRPPVCAADLDLNSVLEERTSVSIVRKEVDANLPAIFGVTPFPFLLPLTGNVNFSIKAADGLTYAILNDRRLVRFRDLQSGARVLASHLPAGSTIWMDCTATEVHIVKLGSNQRPARLLSMPLAHGSLHVVDLMNGAEILAVHRYDDAIVVVRQHEVRAYALADGRLVGRTPNPHRWINGRFFRGTSHFYFAVWDGERVKFEPVHLPSSVSVSEIPLIFDRHGLEGPWLLHFKGYLLSSETGVKIELPLASNNLTEMPATVSEDGNRLFVPTENSWGRLFCLDEKTLLRHHDIRASKQTLNPQLPLPTRNIYRATESVALLTGGIALNGRKKRRRQLWLNGHGKLQIMPLPNLGGMLTEHHFSTPHLAPQGCHLRTAEFPKGGKIFLDSRGLLHLKSPDARQPEISLVLADGEVAGWSSDGCVCGPSFFFDGPHVSDPAGIYRRMMDILAKL